LNREKKEDNRIKRERESLLGKKKRKKRVTSYLLGEKSRPRRGMSPEGVKEGRLLL